MKNLFIQNKFLTRAQRILLMLILITQSIFIIYQIKNSINNQATREDKTLSNNNTRIISKAALDILIKKASDEEYLVDVLNGTPKLPMLKHPPQLVPASQVLQPTNQNDFQNQPEIKTSFQVNQTTKIQECHYQGQTYLAGDIVKTNQGWIRCMPVVSSEKTQTQSEPSWVVNQ